MGFKVFVVAAFSASLVMAKDDNGNLALSFGANDTLVAKRTGMQEATGTGTNSDTCLLQFLSLECNDNNCGELNGYELICVSKGLQDGKEKKMCECKPEDVNVCQNSVNPNVTSTGTVPQYGECNEQNHCIDSYGYISTSKEEGPICAEKLHCLQEVNTTATEPASMCHTCMSCISQNDAAGQQLVASKRFDCTLICSKEILDSVAERNAAGVGIADSYTVAPSTNTLDHTNSARSNNGSVAGSRSGAAAVRQTNLGAILSATIVIALIAATQ